MTALVYITADEVRDYLDQIEDRNWPIREIGFTGGEPFMNPQMIDITRAALERGYEVLILTNAMRPMMRKTMQAGLLNLRRNYRRQADPAHFRRSLVRRRITTQNAAPALLPSTLEGMEWLRDAGIRMAVAGRTVWGESDADARAGYAALFADNTTSTSTRKTPAMTVLFPEMDETVEVPEITTACWDILGKSPDAVMCSSSRMVVKRKGAARPAVLACTLLPYDARVRTGRPPWPRPNAMSPSTTPIAPSSACWAGPPARPERADPPRASSFHKYFRRRPRLPHRPRCPI